MKRAVTLLFITSAWSCGPTESAVTSNEPDEVSEEADALCSSLPPSAPSCVTDGSPDAPLLLAAMNGSSYTRLRNTYALSSTQANRVYNFRKGPDGVIDTTDDRTFTSVAQLRAKTGFLCCTLVRLVRVAQSITTCRDSDGVCPASCTSSNDCDCPVAPVGPVCGNGRLESGELCDGNCPAACDDGNACTTDALSGAAATCNAVCASTPITACVSGDGCCAPGCNFRTDADCTAPTYTIGENSSLGALYADDDVVVHLNGTEVFRDYGTGAGRVGISFAALPGDWVTMRFYDTVGYAKAHGEIWLGGTNLPAVKVFDGLNGGRSNYPARPNAAFDIVVFQIPNAGEAVVLGCMPDEALDTSWWQKSSNLTIRQATTKQYYVTWNVPGSNQYGTWPRDYNFNVDCRGWVGDVFVSGAGWATVQWNTVTHQLRTYPVGGQAYNDSIARASAQHAVNTLFPAGDLSMLQINY